MKTLLIVNAHYSNRGDEAALRAIIDTILKEKVDWNIRVLFKDRKDVIGFPYEDNKRVSWISTQFLPNNIDEIYRAIDFAESGEKTSLDEKLMTTVLECKSADLIVYSPGGAVISDNFWWVKNLEYLTPFLCAKEFGIPIVTAAPSMGPFDAKVEKENNYLRSSLLKGAKKIIVREALSKQYLEQIGVKENVARTVDSAFLDDLGYNNIEQFEQLKKDLELNAFLEKYKRVIGVTVSDFSWHVKYKDDDKLLGNIRAGMNSLLDYLEKQGVGVLFFPQLFGNQSDEEIINEYRKNYNNTFMLSKKYDTYFQQTMVSMIYAVIGMRYHCNIFAAKMATPFIALAYEEKMEGFMKDWKLDNFLLKITDINEDNIIALYEELDSCYDEYKEQLLLNRESWRKQARITIDSIYQFMKGE